MGEPVKMVDLAHDLVQLSGLQVGRDIDIVFTGVRPGEKLFEELFGGVEKFDRTRHEKIFVAQNGHPRLGALSLGQQVDKLVEAARAGRPEEVGHWLSLIVPEFHPAEAAPLPRVDGAGSPGPLPVRLSRSVETGD